MSSGTRRLHMLRTASPRIVGSRSLQSFSRVCGAWEGGMVAVQPGRANASMLQLNRRARAARHTSS